MREHYKNKGTLICKDFIYKRYATKIFGSWSAAMIASIGKTNINKSFERNCEKCKSIIKNTEK